MGHSVQEYMNKYGWEQGQDFDALVAEEVMGWTVNRNDGGRWETIGPDDPRRFIGPTVCEDGWIPSVRHEDAWDVLDRLTSYFGDHGFGVTVTFEKNEWVVIEAIAGDWNCPHDKPYDPEDGHGATWAEAYGTNFGFVLCVVAVLLVRKLRGELPKNA